MMVSELCRDSVFTATCIMHSSSNPAVRVHTGEGRSMKRNSLLVPVASRILGTSCRSTVSEDPPGSKLVEL